MRAEKVCKCSASSLFGVDAVGQEGALITVRPDGVLLYGASVQSWPVGTPHLEIISSAAYCARTQTMCILVSDVVSRHRRALLWPPAFSGPLNAAPTTIHLKATLQEAVVDLSALHPAANGSYDFVITLVDTTVVLLSSSQESMTVVHHPGAPYQALSFSSWVAALHMICSAPVNGHSQQSISMTSVHLDDSLSNTSTGGHTELAPPSRNAAVVSHCTSRTTATVVWSDGTVTVVPLPPHSRAGSARCRFRLRCPPPLSRHHRKNSRSHRAVRRARQCQTNGCVPAGKPLACAVQLTEHSVAIFSVGIAQAAPADALGYILIDTRYGVVRNAGAVSIDGAHVHVREHVYTVRTEAPPDAASAGPESVTIMLVADGLVLRVRVCEAHGRLSRLVGCLAEGASQSNLAAVSHALAPDSLNAVADTLAARVQGSSAVDLASAGDLSGGAGVGVNGRASGGTQDTGGPQTSAAAGPETERENGFNVEEGMSTLAERLLDVSRFRGSGARDLDLSDLDGLLSACKRERWQVAGALAERAAQALAQIGDDEHLRELLAAHPLMDLSKCASILQAAASNGQLELLASLLAHCWSVHEGDLCALVGVLLDAASRDGPSSAALSAHHRLACEEAGTLCDRAEATPTRKRPMMKAAGAAEALEGFSERQLVCHCVLACRLDEGTVTAVCRSLSSSATLRLAVLLHRWLIKLTCGRFAALLSQGCRLRTTAVPNLLQVLTWCQCLIDTHAATLAAEPRLVPMFRIWLGLIHTHAAVSREVLMLHGTCQQVRQAAKAVHDTTPALALPGWTTTCAEFSTQMPPEM